MYYITYITYLMTSDIFINLKTASADVIVIITLATDKGRSFCSEAQSFGYEKMHLL